MPLPTPPIARTAACLWAWALALITPGLSAAPVALNFSTTSTEVHEYFAHDPVIRAWAQFNGGSGTMNLERGVWQTVGLMGVSVGTGAPVDGCCQNETHDFHLDLTVAGIVRQLSASVEMKEILHNQYQYTLLDMDPVEMDLGAIGVLTIDLSPMAFQMLANTPFYGPATTAQARVMLLEPLQAVSSPGTLSLALMALSVAAFALPGVLPKPRRA